MYNGVEYRFSTSHNFRKFTGFWWGFGCVKRDKIKSLASILMKFSTLVVKISLKQKINKILYFWVKKVVFEELNLRHLERIAFHRNCRWPCRKHPLKIVA